MPKLPELVDDWHTIARKAWSVKLALLSALFSAAEFALPYIAPSTQSGRFAALAGVVSLGAAVSRVVAQPKLWN